MNNYDLFNDSLDEFASPEQRAEMRELGINPDKKRKINPIIWMDMGEKAIWRTDDEA